MFTKPLTKAPRYILIKSFFLAIGWSYLQVFHTLFKKDWNYYDVKMHVKSASFSTDNSRTSRLCIFYRIFNHKIFISDVIATLTILKMKVAKRRLIEKMSLERWKAFWVHCICHVIFIIFFVMVIMIIVFSLDYIFSLN